MAEEDSTMEEEMADDEVMAEVEPNPTHEAMADEATMQEDKAEESMTDEAMMEEDKTEEVAMAGDEAMADEVTAGPAWFNAALVDVNSGQTFTMSDFKGKVVLVETMAVWCPLCTRQQGHIQSLHQSIGERDDLISVSLDIDPNEDADILKAHADKNGFNWHYAVAPPEVAREIGQLYGAQFLNPPATPMFIIDRQGQVHPLSFGDKAPDVLQEALQPFLSEG
jgi:cytochrome oxidase Cu insertion factor (SCO1/SenC/PrrC family)